MYVCMVKHTARVWINRVRFSILLVVSSTGEMSISLSAFAPENLVSGDGFGSPVPRQPAHLHTHTEYGTYLRDSSRVPRRRPFIYFKPPYASGQSRVYRVTHLHTDGVHCRESAGIGPVNLKVVSKECCLGRSPWTNQYAPPFPTTTIGIKWACRKYWRGIGLHDSLHGRQACPEFNSFHQDVGQILPRERLFSYRPLPKRGQIFDIPAPPPIVERLQQEKLS